MFTFNWLRKLLQPQTLIIPRTEARICFQCKGTFSYHAMIRVDGNPRCPACASEQVVPLFPLLKYVRQHAHLSVVQKTLTEQKPPKMTDNMSLYLTDFEGPRPMRKSKKPERLPETI